MCSHSVTVCIRVLSILRCTMDVRDGVTNQQNEHVGVPTVIAHMVHVGGVRLGFEGLHGLLGCSQRSQGYMNRARYVCTKVCVVHCGRKNTLPLRAGGRGANTTMSSWGLGPRGHAVVLPRQGILDVR